MPEKKKSATKAKRTFKAAARSSNEPAQADNQAQTSQIETTQNVVEIISVEEVSSEASVSNAPVSSGVAPTQNVAPAPQAPYQIPEPAQQQPVTPVQDVPVQPGQPQPVEQVMTQNAPLQPVSDSSSTVSPAVVQENIQIDPNANTAMVSETGQNDQQLVDAVVAKELAQEQIQADPVVANQTTPTNDVTVVEEGGGVRWMLILVILFLVGVIGGLGYLFIFQAKPTTDFSQNATPPADLKTVKVSGVSPTVVQSSSKTSFSLSVLNGSSTPGLAATGKDYLSGKGYKVVGVGNADNSDYTKTEIKVKKSVSSAFVSQLETDLSGKYSVDSSTAALAESAATDVVVIIGSK